MASHKEAQKHKSQFPNKLQILEPAEFSRTHLFVFSVPLCGLSPAAEAGVVDDLGPALQVEFLH